MECMKHTESMCADEMMKREKVLYQLTDTFYCAVKEPSCCTCKHCTDVFWDYSNGIYMLLCEYGNNNKKEYCDKYEFDGIKRPNADDEGFRKVKREAERKWTWKN